jgi:hypothetical protein
MVAVALLEIEEQEKIFTSTCNNGTPGTKGVMEDTSYFKLNVNSSIAHKPYR